MTEHNGIKTEISFDKKEYEENDIAKISVSLINDNSFIVSGVSGKIELSKNLCSEDALEIVNNIDLKPNEKITKLFYIKLLKDVEKEEIFVDKDIMTNISVNTGNSYKDIYVYITIAIIAIVVVVSVRTKKLKKFLSIIISASIVITLMDGFEIRADNMDVKANSRSYTSPFDIKFTDKSETIVVEVFYDYMKEMNLITINTEKYSYDDEKTAYEINDEDVIVKGTLVDSELYSNITIQVYNIKGKQIYSDTIDATDNWKFINVGLFPGINNVVVTAIGKESVSTDVKLYDYFGMAFKKIPNSNKDEDNDGVVDMIEEYWGTDLVVPDTDRDGLTDYQEINEIGTDPLIEDTDEDGVSDANEDTDEDGLTNIEEYKYNTTVFSTDTDGDSLSDYNEIMVYNTNPLSKDTDNDSADDKWEINNGFNPIVYNELFLVKNTIQGQNTSVEIELVADGDSASSFDCGVYENDQYYINSTLPGYLGSAYEFNIDGVFETAKIKYFFEEENINDEGFEPVVYYYNTEQNILEEIETHWDGVSNYVTADLQHFSVYLLLNKNKFDEVWNTQIKTPSLNENGESNLNVAFVVDLSGSMRGNKLSTTKMAIGSFINILEDTDQAGLISFTSSAKLHCNLTNNKEELVRSVDSMSANGLTSIYTGLDKAVDMLINNSCDGYDMIIVFTDGYDEPSTTYDSYYKEIVDKAVEEDICIYTIGIETVDENLLTKIAETTGGKYYYASLISELQEKIDEVKEEAKEIKEDANGDGLIDYYTRMICEGKLRYSTGSVVKGFIGNYDEIQKKADLDNDGLINGKEITIGTTSGGRPCVEMLSDPIKPDTDRDEMSDGEEREKGTNPFYPNASCSDVDSILNNDMYLASIFSQEYQNNFALRAQLCAGNLITNFKYSYVEDYRKTLLTYIQQYTQVTYNEITAQTVKEIELSTIYDISEDLTNYILAITDVANESMEYAKALETAVDCQNKLLSLENSFAQINSYSQIVGFDDELTQTLLNIQVQIEEQRSLFNKVDNTLLQSKLNGKLAKKFGKFNNKLPSKVVKGIKVYKAFNDFLTYGMIAVNTGCSIWETVSIYGGIDAGIIQCEELDEFLELIVENSDISELRDAATHVKYVLESDTDRILVQTSAILKDLEKGLIATDVTLILTNTGPLGWAIYIGLGLGNLISNTGEIDEKMLGVIACGNSADCYSDYVKKQLSIDTGTYYRFPKDVAGEIQLIAQLRIVGEDRYAEAADDRSSLRKWIGKIFADCSQSDIEEYCKEQNEDVEEKCNRFNVIVNKKFNDNFLYND